MEIIKQLHQGWIEWSNAKAKGIKFSQYFGKYQYLYKGEKFEISLVKLAYPFTKRWFWEIYCLNGNLFDNCERFPTKAMADIRIKELIR